MTLTNHTKGVLVTLFGVLIITPDTLMIRLISADQWTLLFWRGLLPGLAIMAGLFFIHGKSFPQRVRAIGKPGIWLAVVFGSGSVLFIFSVMNTTVANVLFIISISPLFSALISRFILHEAIDNRVWYAIFSALIGIAIIAWGSFTGMNETSLLGDLAALGAAIGMAITLSIIHHYRGTDMIPAMGLANLFSAMIALPFAAPLSVMGQDIIWLGLMGLLVVPLSFTLLTIGPRYLPAPEVGLFILLEAVIGPYWVWLVINEHPGNMTLIGGGVVLATLTVLNVTDLIQGLKKRMR